MHAMNNFPEMLSYRPKPAGFQDSELLEFSLKKFGLVGQRQHWENEVAAYARGDKCGEILLSLYHLESGL